MAEFNLIEEPWIPCIDLDSINVEYGIHDTILKAHELREICDDSPLVTVAIHRLLLAILYRAFEGPKSFSAWKSMYSDGVFNPETVNEYLDKWKDGFDLFGNDRPFFQMARFETKKAISVNRLATECANGNNATLFDHSSDDIDVEWSPIQITKRLIACQSFALGFGKSGYATIDGVDEALPYSADAIALRGMSIWLQGKNLFETLMINLAYNDDSSLPPWELDNPNKYRDKLQGKRMKPVTSFGVVDRLTWQSRLVRIIAKDSTISKMYFAQGRSADKSAGDPMKVYRTSKEGGVSPRSLGSSRAAWRDAHSFLMIPNAQSNECRPECFNVVARAKSESFVDSSQSFIAQIVGLATAPNKAGKFLLWRHERMPVSVALLNDVDLIERLGSLLQNAEHISSGRKSGLRDRARRIVKLYLSPDCELPGRRQPDKNEVNKVVEVIDPRPAYWARLEGHFFQLLEDLPDDQETATRMWRDNIKQEAERALQESIRSLGTTARAIQAVARVRTDFNDSDLSPPPQKVGNDKAITKGGKQK